MEALGSDDTGSGDGVANMLHQRPDRPEDPYVDDEDDKEKSMMWDNMSKAVLFKNFLKSAGETNEAWVNPSIRCVVVTDGEVVWKQTIAADSLAKWETNPYEHRST